MESYIFLQFDDNVKVKEYKIYQTKLIHTLKKFFTILPKDYDKNVVGKRFSIYLSLGKKSSNIRHENAFYRYLEYESSFPDIAQIIKKISEIYTLFNKPYFTQHNSRVDVIVFDMDDTLIDGDQVPFYQNIFKELKEYRNYFKYVVLWTHGITSYLAEIKLDFKFDLYMSRSNEDSENKGLGAVLRELNNSTHAVKKLDFCVLVDDAPSNFNNDYDLFVNIDKRPIPGSYSATLKKIVYCMDRYYQKKSFPNEISISNNESG